MRQSLECRAYLVWVMLVLAASPSLNAQSKALTSGLPTDYVLYATLKTNLSSTHSKVGDRVELEITKSAKSRFFGANPDFLPLHTRLIGTVTRIQPASKEQPAALAIRVTEVGSKDVSAPIDSKLGYFGVVAKIYDLPMPSKDRDGMWLVMDGRVDPDEVYGSVFYAKHNFFLYRDQAALTLIPFDQGQGNRTISGRVYDALHTPISGASVILTTEKVGGWETETGPDGTYAFNHLSPKNKYQLHAHYMGEETRTQTIDPTFFEAVSKLAIDFQLKTGQTRTH